MIDHMMDRLKWFQNLEEVPQGRWPMMIVDNNTLWVHKVGNIIIWYLVGTQWEKKTLRRMLYMLDL